MPPLPFNEIRTWMFDDALPFWASQGVDRARGGFFEELDFAGEPTAATFKRTRVVCRQIYAFAHAALLGWPPGERWSAYGYDYLVSHAWLGPDRGWARLLTAGGELLDPTPDLYDHAFVLFALAWRFRVSGDPDALRRAHETLDFIDVHLRPESGEGLLHQWPPVTPRLQNPHMHLLEASLAWLDAADEARFRTLAGELVSLFRSRFFDGRTLGEYFTDDWTRVPDERGRIVEPGHQFEWAWILGQAGRRLALDLRDEMHTLVGFAERHGVDPATGLTANRVRDDGAPIDRGSRTWPNTERLKGHLALLEADGVDSRAAILSSIRVLFDRYLAVTPRGTWIDHLDAAGAPIATAVPTSTLYHVFLAFAEVLRLQPSLTAATDPGGGGA